MGKLYIHATNVHQGGGKSLLWSIVKALPTGLSVLVLDSRMHLPKEIPANTQILRVSPLILQRARAERWLAHHVEQQDVVLCFGNLPPLFKLTGHTVVFVQNRYLVEDLSLKEFTLKVRLRIAIERFWLRKKMQNADEFVVQTPTMKRLLEKIVGGKIPIRVLPFMESLGGYLRKVQQPAIQEKKDFDFVYVASGEPHKNHRRLLEAWCQLAEEGLHPSLCLTLNELRFATLCHELDVMRQRYGLKVINAGELSHNDALSIYKIAGASIYPSTLESFGLPLIEARQAGLAVLASELDYVRDVLDPEETFDPESSISIARAVKRFLNQKEQELSLLDAAQFIACVLERNNSKSI